MKYISIAELGRVVTGKTPPTDHSEYFGGEIPFITPSDIETYDKRYVEYTERTLTTQGASSIKGCLLPPKSICFVCIGSTIGKSCMTKCVSYTNQQINSIIPNQSCIGDYLFYLLKYIKGYFQSVGGGTGSGKGIVNKTLFQKTKVMIHNDLNVQQRIASILSAYDDLIENNNRRIKILEKMSENLYKEWFVRFRFPGHEQAEFENGIPKGWERVRLSDIIDFNPTIKKTNHSEYKIIPMSALSNTGLLIDDSLYETSGKLEGSRSCNGDTLVARITPCLENGKTGFVQGLKPGEVVGGSTEFIVMRAKVISRLLVYFIARDPLFRGFAIASMNGADGRQRVKVEKLERTQWIKPDGHINAAFEEKCEPIFGLIYKLYRENKNLTKQRDKLLPRLMSGKLEV